MSKASHTFFSNTMIYAELENLFPMSIMHYDAFIISAYLSFKSKKKLIVHPHALLFLINLFV